MPNDEAETPGDPFVPAEIDELLRSIEQGFGDGNEDDDAEDEDEDEDEDALTADAIFAAMVDAFDQLPWPNQIHAENRAVTLNLTAEHASYALYFHVPAPLRLIGSRVSAGFRVPEAKRVALCEALNRANYGLRIGNFEMDMRDGEVVFRIGQDCTALPDMLLLERMISTSIDTFERYVPALMRIMYADISPERAIAEVEG